MDARTVVFLLIVTVSNISASPHAEKENKRELKPKPDLHEKEVDEDTEREVVNRLEHSKREKVEEEASELNEREFPERPREVEQDPQYWKGRFAYMKREELFPELPRHFEAKRFEELLPAPGSEFEENFPRLKKEEMEESPDQYWKGRFRFLDEGEKQRN